MPTKQKERGTVLTCPECGHGITVMDKKVIMVSNKANNGTLKDVSRKIRGPHPDTIKRALKRLGMYPDKKKGENGVKNEI